MISGFLPELTLPPWLVGARRHRFLATKTGVARIDVARLERRVLYSAVPSELELEGQFLEQLERDPFCDIQCLE